jgi:hypothetical protein
MERTNKASVRRSRSGICGPDPCGGWKGDPPSLMIAGNELLHAGEGGGALAFLDFTYDT